MKHLMTVTLVAAVACATQAAVPATEAKLAAQLPSIFAQAADQYRGLVKQMDGKEDCFPKRGQDGKLVTSGGRVLGVTAVASDLKGAIAAAYEKVKTVRFENAYYRKDIGQRALKAKEE